MKVEKNKTDNQAKMIRELKRLGGLSVSVGYFDSNMNSHLLIIARANEFGAHIVPKNGQWLTIPTKDTPKQADGTPMPAKEIPNLFRPKGKNVLAIPAGSKFKVVYYLVKKVDIPKRPFIRVSMITHKKRYEQEIQMGIDKIIRGEETAYGMLQKIGYGARKDIIQQIIAWDDPRNAPATVERKGNDNPLVDTGKLASALDVFVMEDW